MLRSLWTGATGMISQQDAVDTISNNLANVNTVGYKKETIEFKTLLYSKLQTKVTDSDGERKPVIGQVGAGVRTASIISRYTQGSMNATGNLYDFALEGEGFFQVQMPDGTTAYTRNGAFSNMSIGNDGLTLCTSDGYAILSDTGEPIVFDFELESSNFIIDEDGHFWYQNADKTVTDTGVSFGIVQFSNPSGLLKKADSLLYESVASGAPMAEKDNPELHRTSIHSGYLEGSNVETVDEMVNLIVAQRAYEMNSKVITASDQMLQQANNLRS